jgi:hypothetical protein
MVVGVRRGCFWFHASCLTVFPRMSPRLPQHDDHPGSQLFVHDSWVSWVASATPRALHQHTCPRLRAPPPRHPLSSSPNIRVNLPGRLLILTHTFAMPPRYEAPAVPAGPFPSCFDADHANQTCAVVENGNCLSGLSRVIAHQAPDVGENEASRRATTATTTPVASHSAQPVSRKRQRSDISRVDASYPRKRAITACRHYRSRKVKCNNARPTCGNCEVSKASCVYEDSQDLSR